MSRYSYTDKERDLNKVLKMNQNESLSLDKEYLFQIEKLDFSIESSEYLLKSLDYELPDKRAFKNEINFSSEIKETPSYETLVKKANEEIAKDIELEDLLSEKEFKKHIQGLIQSIRNFREKQVL